MDHTRFEVSSLGNSQHPSEVPMSDSAKTVLDAMRAAGEPVNAGAVCDMTGLDRKEVDKAMAALKKSGEIESPVRCKWQPKA